MSDDIKKLLSIMNETTTSGSVAPVAGGMGKSMLKRPADSIFAAESVPQDADTGLEAAPKVDSPSNFGLWKNSAVIGAEQYGKHGRKKTKVDKTTIYPQLAEAVEPEQSVIDNTRRSRLGSERNAGLNEPDEKPDFGGSKSRDFGTWHFKFDSGNIVKKDGKPLLASSIADAKGIVDRASQNGVTIRIVSGAPEDLSETYNAPKDMDEWTEEDWREWDDKVGRVGAKAKAQEKEQEGVAESNFPSTDELGDRAGAWRGRPEAAKPDFKPRLTKKGAVTKHEKSHQSHLKSMMQVKKAHGGLTGPKGILPEQGVAEGLEPQVGDAVYYGKRLVGWFKGYSEHGKIITEPNYEEMGDEYANRDVYWDPQAKITIRPEQGMAEGAPIVVAQAPIDIRNPKKAAQPYRNQGDIIPPTKPPSTEKRGVKGRPGQRPMPKNEQQEFTDYQRAVMEGVAEGKEDKIAQLKKDYDTAVHWSKNEKSPQKREAARQKAEKIKRHLDTQYKTKLDEYSEWDGTGDQDLAAATAANGQEAGFTDIEDKTSLSEAEITEEMIADRLKNELALFKKGSKPKDKTIGKKPADREVQSKDQKKSDEPKAKKSEPKKSEDKK